MAPHVNRLIAAANGDSAPLVSDGRSDHRRATCRSSATASTQFVPVDDIVAVHANAHYTYVFDGTAKLFCPLAISDVEARLDRSRFVRVHRSHIVNLEPGRRAEAGRRQRGDRARRLDRYTVPVSRSRFGGLRSRLAAVAPAMCALG